MEFQMTGKINSSDDTEMLATLEWFKGNYGSKITKAQCVGSTRQIRFTLLEITFNEIVATFSVIKSQFGDRLEDYNLTMTQ